MLTLEKNAVAASSDTPTATEMKEAVLRYNANGMRARSLPRIKEIAAIEVAKGVFHSQTAALRALIRVRSMQTFYQRPASPETIARAEHARAMAAWRALDDTATIEQVNVTSDALNAAFAALSAIPGTPEHADAEQHRASMDAYFKENGITPPTIEGAQPATAQCPAIVWYDFTPEDCAHEVVSMSQNTVVDFQDRRREFHIFLRADGYELTQFISGAPGRLESTPGFATVALAKAAAIEKHFAPTSAPATLQGVCPAERVCECGAIFSPEITEHDVCADCAPIDWSQ